MKNIFVVIAQMNPMRSANPKRSKLFIWVLCALALFTSTAQAQQQFQGLCARVKIEILQELTIERIGFEATLEITDNDGADPITDFSARLTFEDPNKTTADSVNDASALFFVQTPTFENINSIDGTGVIGPTKTAVMRWFIIPKITAGGTTPQGIRYRVGAQLAGKFKGTQLPADVLQVFPDNIFVKPEPQLEITYFQPRDVQGDNPFTTDVVESPIPFTLGVLVKNTGYGIAHQVKINSQQPTIVENIRHLLLVAQLLGTRVNDSPLQTANLLVNIGDLNPGQARKGAWDMITSLSGEFTEFKASYTHASELGGEETSVIKSIAAHFIAHEVINDQSGRDSIKDFLADTDRDPDMIPDALYESEGNILPVNYLANATVATSGNPFTVTLTADRDGWGYMRLNDPGQANLRIESIVRSDGKSLNTNNFWTNIRYDKITNAKSTFLNIFDKVELGDYTYTVKYAPSLNDTTPPVVTLNFAGVATPVAGKTVITPQTQMYFLADDQSLVSILYSLTNGPFRPGLPFTIPTPGEYPIRYYATDSANNNSGTNSATLVVFDGPPAFAALNLSGQNFFVAGDALSVRPSRATIGFKATPGATRVDAQIDIFQGVRAWATVAGVPSSPSSDTGAILQIAGDNVDYYRFKLDTGPWSGDQLVATPLNLQGLSQGSHGVRVQGRSQFGGYGDEAGAVEVDWVISSTAPATRVTGTPATPTSSRSATLAVSGTGVSTYRWTINHDFYRVETPVATPFSLSALTGTQQVVSVIGKIGGTFQETNNATTISWTIDPNYGSDFSALPQVRSVTITNVSASLQNFVWDGADDDGNLQLPGWYLVRLTLRDQLGNFSFATRLVNISEMSGANNILAAANHGAKNPHARGKWAVWQDQASGNYEIAAEDLSSASPAIVPVTSAGLNQENPKTDGRYVVWQSRQANGNWDIWWKDLSTSTAVQMLTSTPDQDETNPAIDWPWIVYQSRATATATAPWQLFAHNLVTGVTSAVNAGPQDQLDPDVQAGRVVWQDHRDPGVGEIYFKNLESGEMRRLTTNSFGQYFPTISDNWVAWQDNRNGQVDIYGFDLLRNIEVRVTSTAENEARPYLDGPWLVCEEDSLGPLTANLRLISMSSLQAVPLTRNALANNRPALSTGRVVWQQADGPTNQILSATLPSLQAVFQNRNAVPVTASLASYANSAFSLLNQWHTQAGITEIATYGSLVPTITSLSAKWQGSGAVGDDFAITPGSFLWVKFGDNRVLDLGLNPPASINLSAGVNIATGATFPGHYTSFKLLTQLGFANAHAVRMLDSESGRWLVAEVRGSAVVGDNFSIPNVAVLFVDMASAVNGFKPE